MTLSQPLEIARALVDDLYTHGRIELVGQLCAAAFVHHDPVSGDLDRKGLEENVVLFRRAFPDLRIEILEQVSSGDRVVMRWRASGTHRGEFLGIPASGRSGSVEGITMGRYANGKAVESFTQYDALGLLRQIGALPTLTPLVRAPHPAAPPPR